MATRSAPPGRQPDARRARPRAASPPLLALALLLPAGAHGQEPAARSPEHTVTVEATATVRREPDEAVLHVAVENTAATARQAAETNAARTEAVLAALRRLGVPRDRIRTAGYRLEPQYEYRRDGEPGPPRLTGYRATNTLEITSDELARLGPLIDTAIAAGANRVDGPFFQLRDPQAARLEALRLAIARARAEAEAIATAAGRRLGPLLAVSTTAGPVPLRAARITALEAAPAPTPIEPGTLEVTATIHATYRLEP